MREFSCIAILRDILPDDVEEIVNVLIDEGINKIEISLSNEEIGYSSILETIRLFKGKILVGAGTVTKVNQILKLKEIGIDFIITPAYDDELVKTAIIHNIEIIPGVFSPCDVMKALNNNITNLKLFPFNAFDIEYIKSLRGPFPKANFYAVGGVNVNNIKEIYNAGFIGIAPGNDLVKRGSTKADVENIRNKARKYVEEVKNACK